MYHAAHVNSAYTGSFYIQSCVISTDNTTLLVKCTFFINSTATGFVVVDNEQNEEAFNRTLLTDGDKGSVNITGLPAGEYSVRVFDFVNDKRPAYEHNKTLLIFSLPPAPSIKIYISPSSVDLLGKMQLVHGQISSTLL